MGEIVDENGTINYEQALHDLKEFLYGRKGKIDKDLHFSDLRYYLKPLNLLFALRSFSLNLILKLLNIWRDIGYKNLRRYFQLSVIGVVNTLKEQAKTRRDKSK